jgi:hypothetical protein
VNWGAGSIDCNNSPVIDNYGLWNAQTDNTLVGNNPYGSTTFNNYGTFRKSGGSGTNTMDNNTVFNTSGTLDIQTGTLSVSEGSGNGVVNVGGTSIAVGNNFTFSGGTLFTGGGIVTGYLIGNNAVFSGTVNCSGDILSGTMTVATNSVLNLGALNVTFDPVYSGAGILTNYGTVNWGAGSIDCNNSPVIDNYGLWNAQTNDALIGSNPYGSTTFNNYGTFRKSGGSGTNTMDINTVFNTSGTVDIQTGTLSIYQGGGNGVVNVGGTSIAVGNNFTFSGGTLFTGGGIVTGYLIGSNAVFSGTVNCSGDILSGTLTIATNSVLNLGALNVTFDSVYSGADVGILTNYGTVNWGDGSIDCNHSPVIDNYGLWNAQTNDALIGSNPYGSTTFNNYGTFRKSGGSGTNTMDINTVFNTTGMLDIQTGTLSVFGGRGNGTVNVGGTSIALGNNFTFSGGTLFTGGGIVTGYLIGSNAVFSGTVNCSGDILSGTMTVATNSVLNLGALNVTFDSVYAGTGILTNYGTLNWSSGNLYCNNGPVIDNYGLWNAQADSSVFGRQTSGNMVVNNYGTFRKSGGSGTNTMDGNTIFNTTGTLDIQTGTLGLIGSCSLATGVLNFGINSSNNFGRINVSGSAALGGTVSANLNNLYAPRTNSSFAVLAYNSRTGNFASYNLPAGLVWTNNYGNSAFSLLVTTVLPAKLSGAAVAQNGSTFSFNFGAVPGQNYQIQYTTNLAPANWVNLGGTITASNSTVTVSNTIQNPQLFYRAVLQ